MSERRAFHPRKPAATRSARLPSRIARQVAIPGPGMRRIAAARQRC